MWLLARLPLTVTANELQHNVIAGPVICQQGSPLQCYQPSAPDSLQITTNTLSAATLTASVSTLALKTDGEARKITITNTGPNAATNVSLNLSPALPAGTTLTPSSCGTIALGGTCILTILPGSTPSAPPGVNNPTPVTLTVAGDNTNTLTETINILTYGSMSGCGTQMAPTLQNMQSNLIDNGAIGNIFGIYWSSTEASSNPTGSAWVQVLATGGLTQQGPDDKFEQRGVRCVRFITP